MKLIEKKGYSENLSKVNPLVKDALNEIFENSFQGVIYKNDVEKLLHFMNLDLHKLLKTLIPFAGLYSIIPISNFKVGSVSLGNSGNIYFGANLELEGEALSSTIHSEQSNIVNVFQNREAGIKALALPAAPCGHCRQFLYELNDGGNIEIILPETEPIKLDQLLPHAFGPLDLGIEREIFNYKIKELSLEFEIDEVVQQALAAAKMSYSPYSNCYSGVALMTSDKKIYSGSYLENVAFNPGVLPLQACLASLTLKSGEINDAERIVLVEWKKGKISMVSATQALAQSLLGIDVEVFKAD